jgi:hypothetical protein
MLRIGRAFLPPRRFRLAAAMRVRWWVYPIVLVVVFAVLLTADAALWLLTTRTTGDAQKAWIASAATVAGAVVGVIGTSLGAFLTAAFAYRSTRQAECRAAYVKLMSAAAAYQIARRRAAALLQIAEDADTDLKKAAPADVTYRALMAAKIAADGVSQRAHDDIPRLRADVESNAAAVRLIGPKDAATAASKLVAAAQVKDENWEEADFLMATNVAFTALDKLT